MSRRLRPGASAILWREVDPITGEERLRCTSPTDERYLATLPPIEGWVGTWRGPNGEPGTLNAIPPENMYVSPDILARRPRRPAGGRDATRNPGE